MRKIVREKKVGINVLCTILHKIPNVPVQNAKAGKTPHTSEIKPPRKAINKTTNTLIKRLFIFKLF
jgi:hypothetical protein